jgi:uncharacterized protein (DUF427 family)
MEAVVQVEESPARVRVRFGGETVADTKSALLLKEQGHRPVYYVPLADVRADLISPTNHSSFCPRKGTASYWTINTSDGDRVAENAMWGYPDPIPSCPDISGYVAFYRDRVDEILVDDEAV